MRLSLRPDPEPFDVDAWRARLVELRAEPASDFRDDLIDYAEAHLAAISPEAKAGAAPGAPLGAEP